MTLTLTIQDDERSANGVGETDLPPTRVDKEEKKR